MRSTLASTAATLLLCGVIAAAPADAQQGRQITTGLQALLTGKRFTIPSPPEGSATQYFNRGGDWRMGGVHPGGRTGFSNFGRWAVEGQMVCAYTKFNSRTLNEKTCFKVYQEGAQLVLVDTQGGRWTETK